MTRQTLDANRKIVISYFAILPIYRATVIGMATNRNFHSLTLIKPGLLTGSGKDFASPKTSRR